MRIRNIQRGELAASSNLSRPSQDGGSGKISAPPPPVRNQRPLPILAESLGKAASNFGNTSGNPQATLPRSSIQTQYHISTQSSGRSSDESTHGSSATSNSQPSSASEISQHMQQKIAHSARAIEENFPWSKKRRFGDGLAPRAP